MSHRPGRTGLAPGGDSASSGVLRVRARNLRLLFSARRLVFDVLRAGILVGPLAPSADSCRGDCMEYRLPFQHSFDEHL